MKVLLDTHLILWAASDSPALPDDARTTLENPAITPYFSVASMWEIVIKHSLGREDFQVDARVLRRNLLDAGYEELSIESKHVFEVAGLPSHHRDPFDRLLIAQSIVEGIVLLTHDEQVRKYHLAPIQYV
jgi:PIN domain nuclease of toxin-antitoxin system